MDISLSGQIDGVEAARRIREKRNVPVIFISAHSDAATLAPYLDRGGRVRAQVSAVRGGTKDRPELNVWILVRALDQI